MSDYSDPMEVCWIGVPIERSPGIFDENLIPVGTYAGITEANAIVLDLYPDATLEIGPDGFTAKIPSGREVALIRWAHRD